MLFITSYVTTNGHDYQNLSNAWKGPNNGIYHRIGPR